MRRSLKKVGCGDLQEFLRVKPRSDEQKLHIRHFGMDEFAKQSPILPEFQGVNVVDI